MSLDAANLKEILPEKRYTLMVALLNHMRVRVRDDLAEMFIRRMSAIHKRAREELEQIQSRRRAQMEKLVALLDGVVDIVAEGEDDAEIGRQVRCFLAPSGDLEPLRESCAEVRALRQQLLALAVAAFPRTPLGNAAPGRSAEMGVD